MPDGGEVVVGGRRGPNTRLRAARHALGLSQSQLAAAVREAGRMLGEPNGCSKRLVQKWESGTHLCCRVDYRRALERVTGLPYDALGFRAGLAEPARGRYDYAA